MVCVFLRPERRLSGSKYKRTYGSEPFSVEEIRFLQTQKYEDFHIKNIFQKHLNTSELSKVICILPAAVYHDN